MQEKVKETDRVIVKIISSMEKVFPEHEPCNEEYKSICPANETYNFQLVYKNLEDTTLKRNEIKIKSNISEKIHLKMEEYVPMAVVPTKYKDDYYLGGAGIYPDKLRDFEFGDIVLPSNLWKAVWVSVDIDESIKPGNYDIQFDLIGENGVTISTCCYNLEVIDILLEDADLKYTNWIHYDSISNYHNVKPFSKEFYVLFAKYLELYRKIGGTMLLTPLFTPPLDTYIGGERKTIQLVNVGKNSGKYKFDFSDLEKFIDFIRCKGIKYIEFSHLFSQWGGKYCPKIMATVDGEYKRIFGWDTESESPEYVEFIDAFLPALVDFIKVKGLTEICYFHITDEPSSHDMEKYKRLRKMVKKHIGNMPVMDAISDVAFYDNGLVDAPVPITSSFVKFADKNIENLFVYYCCGPTDGYYSNRLLNMPLQRTRILGIQLYLNNAKGFLHWGFNFYNTAFSYREIDPNIVNDAGGFFPGGDSFIVYPFKDDVSLSLRGEALAEAYNDYRSLKTLEKYTGRQTVINIIRAEGLRNFDKYPRSAKWHSEFMGKIYKYILNFQNSKIYETNKMI